MSIPNKFHLLALCGALGASSLLLGCDADGQKPLQVEPKSSEESQKPLQVEPKSPDESLKTIVVQDGYKMELVAAEPLVQEPVLFTFDGNGRMYVAEMLTYMLDADGTGQMKPVSRIVRLEDTDGDGVMDKSVVFADKLLLPRMIQTLQDGKILVRETNTEDLLLFTDSNGDGVADKRETVHEGGPRGGNMEHQPSGLIWNIDNWMYVTYEDKRYKVDGNKIITQEIAYGGGQWGLGQDETGRLYYSTAGGENPALAFQVPPIYGRTTVKDEQAPGFREVFPLDATPDVQGGLSRLRPDNTLKQFTGIAGQSIYLGNKLPELYGNYFAPEPVGNLIRRAHVTRQNGYTVLSHPYQSEKKEFIASRDPNFRPIWSDTAPDGTLMVVDMYRGIIQESAWTKKGSYLRGVIDEYGFDKIIGRGRIYRVTKPGVVLDKAPKMYQETPSQLIAHLSHENFWWRLTAQKLIVLSQDKSVTPVLKKLALTSKNPLARLHAIWTLDGLGVVDQALLLEKMSDQDARVAAAAVRISEQLAVANEKVIAKAWLTAAQKADVEVAQQAILSAYLVGLKEETSKAIMEAAKARFLPAALGLSAIEANVKFLAEEKVKQAKLAATDGEFAAAVMRGEKHFKALCSSCHGEDGKGSPMPGGLIAPSFHKNAQVSGNLAVLGRIMLNGLTGPINGITYGGGMMPSLSDETDEYIADTLSYLRGNFENNAGLVLPEQIAEIRKLTNQRKLPWTMDELAIKYNNELPNKSQWKLSASHGQPELLPNLIDGNEKNAWRMGRRQEPGMWLQVELPKLASISKIKLVSFHSKEYYPRGYKLEFSTDGKSWELIDENIKTKVNMSSETLGRSAKFIKISLLNGHSDVDWRMNELIIYGSEI